MLKPKAIAAAHSHALMEFPKESVGFIVAGRYIPVKNVHEDPLNFFQVSDEDYLKYSGRISAVLHSHPNGPVYPTSSDMQGQIDTDIPWGIIPVDSERVGGPIMWGDALPTPPVIGREFMHGIADCYDLVRDVYRQGKTNLAAEAEPVAWPLDPILLPRVPRDWEWWDHGHNLYMDSLLANGFKIIDQSEARPGDGFLMKVLSPVVNHGGVLLEGNLMLHHLPHRMSRREPVGPWLTRIAHWVRYNG